MKLHHWIASALLAVGVVSCTESGPPAAQTQTMLQASAVAQAQPAPRQDSPVQPKVQKVSVEDDSPIPPVDALWTIYCDSITGVGHIENGRILKSRLVALTGMHGWYVIHGDKESTLYYGYYRSMDLPAEKRRAEADRLKVAGLTDRLGNHLVRGGILQPINPADPVAPGEWNLVNAPKKAYWTIEIATFTGNPKRKEAAVQMVRELREKGETLAYYYHGSTVSSVCIGAWPRDAVAEQGTGIDTKGQMRDDAHSSNADQSLFVFSGLDQAPPNVAARILEPGTSKPMAVEGKRLEYLDQEMKRKTDQYPYHFVNYQLHGTQNGNQTFPDPSVLVVVPHEDAAESEDNWRLTGGQPNVSSSSGNQAAPAGAGDSVLRSIGDR